MNLEQRTYYIDYEKRMITDVNSKTHYFALNYDFVEELFNLSNDFDVTFKYQNKRISLKNRLLIYTNKLIYLYLTKVRRINLINTLDQYTYFELK